MRLLPLLPKLSKKATAATDMGGDDKEVRDGEDDEDDDDTEHDGVKADKMRAEEEEGGIKRGVGKEWKKGREDGMNTNRKPK